jgi:hypothetical protein
LLYCALLRGRTSNPNTIVLTDEFIEKSPLKSKCSTRL